jgi:hypothetical protein
MHGVRAVRCCWLGLQEQQSTWAGLLGAAWLQQQRSALQSRKQQQ